MRVNLDIPLSIEDICEATKAKVNKYVNNSKYITSICTNTKDCKNGDLFIALSGILDSGENYVQEALSKKCSVITAKPQYNALCVKDTSEALLKIAELYKSKLQIKHTVAVTGSVGKSTTVKFLTKILSQKFKVHSPTGNFNNHLGVPLTVLCAPKDTEILVTELGMNHKGEISRLSRCVTPDIAIITSIGTSHIGNLGSREEIARAKLEILDGMNSGTLLTPYGEPLLYGIKNSLSVGRNTSLSNFSLNNGEDGNYFLRSPYGNINGIHFFDTREHLLSDLTFSISAAQSLGLSKNEIIKGVDAITDTDLRQRFIILKDFTIFDDSYNASLESIYADLKFIASYAGPTGAFLGDVLELGKDTDTIHESIGRIAAELNIDHLYLYGKYSNSIAMGAVRSGMSRASIFINTDIHSPDISIGHIMDNHSPKELILFKASHNIRLDKIADLIARKERMNNEGH